MLKSIVLLSAMCLIAAAAPSRGRTYFGPAITIGLGTAWTFVDADARNRPTAFGFEFTAGALSELPAMPNPRDRSLDWPYYLFFPAGAPATGFDHVNIDWHPLGHPPKGIYTVPHFDFHFYLIPVSAQLAIHYPHSESEDMTGVTMPAKTLMPPGYMIPPGTEVNEMGLHALPANAPEFHGKPFTNTLIYGYDTRGALVFVEPMITVKYLLSHPHFSTAIPVPPAYSTPGYYPRRYSVTYDASRNLYRIMYSDLRSWHASQLARR